MKRKEKLLIGVLTIILVCTICILIVQKVESKRIVAQQISETQKLSETKEENSFIKTTTHLGEINNSLNEGVEEGKDQVWKAINEKLSNRLYTNNDKIYNNINSVDALEIAINADNDNYVMQATLENNGELKVNDTSYIKFENSYDAGYSAGVNATAAQSGVEIRNHTHSDSAGCYRYQWNHKCSGCGNSAYGYTTTNTSPPAATCGACGLWKASWVFMNKSKVCNYGDNEVIYLKVGDTVYVDK